MEYHNSGRTTRNSSGKEKSTVHFNLNQETLTAFKFYCKKESDGNNASDDSDEEFSFGTSGADFNFVAIQVTPCPGSNNLDTYPNSYKPDDGTALNRYRYIVLEFSVDSDFQHFREEMECHLAEILPPGDIKKDECHVFAEALMENSRRTRRSKRAMDTQSAFIKGRSSDATLLVFPFAGDEDEIDGAADGLQEASGKLKTNSGYISDGTDEELEDEEARKLSSTKENVKDSNDGEAPKVKVRQHYVTLRVEDYERLQPEEWLNDSLVDFWMQWYGLT